MFCPVTAFQILTSQDTSVNWVVLVQTHLHKEKNSEWANSIIFTSKEDFNEADEMMLVLIRRLKTKFIGK